MSTTFSELGIQAALQKSLAKLEISGKAYPIILGGHEHDLNIETINNSNIQRKIKYRISLMNT